MLSGWGLGGLLQSLPAKNDDDEEASMPGAWDAAPAPVAKPPAVPTIETAEDEDDDDSPAAFPALNSIQRSGGNNSNSSSVNILPSPSIKVLDPDAKLMPPPAMLPPRFSVSGPSSPRSSLGTPSAASSSASNSLLAPMSTTSVPANTNTKSKARTRVALTPGHSALDWARLQQSGEDLRCGVTQLMPITLSEVKEHRSRDDAWSVFNGKVYNITPYLPFHPGGEKELMRVAGRDGTKLFALTHSWVNLDFMLDGCMIGFLVREDT